MPWRRLKIAALLACAGGALLLVLLRPPRYQPRALAEPADFAAFYQQRLQESRARGARPETEERLLRQAPGMTELAILYIHGFSASRAEGEAVVDALSRRYQANTYYLRLPGHGTNKEDQARTAFGDYLDVARQAARVARRLGHRLLVIGTSTGALLATWLAATEPGLCDALVLASPLFEFGDHKANLLAYPGGVALAERLLGGPIRRVPFDPRDPHDHRLPGFDAYWYTEQYVAALRPLAQLKRHAARPEVFGRVAAPALLLYYEDAATGQRDTVIDLAAVKAAFQGFGADTPRRGPHPGSRAVAIAHGDHVLLSRWVRSDLAAAEQAITTWIDGLGVGGPARR